MAEFQDLEIRLQAVDNASKTLEKVVSLLERVKELTGSGSSTSTSNTTNSTKAQVQATKNLADANQKAATSTKKLANEQQNLNSKVTGYKEATKGLTNNQISLINAQNRAAKALKTYNASVDASKQALEELKKAQDNLTAAKGAVAYKNALTYKGTTGSLTQEESTWLLDNPDVEKQLEQAKKALAAAQQKVASTAKAEDSANLSLVNSLNSVHSATNRVTQEQKRNEEQQKKLEERQKKLEEQNKKTATSFATIAAKAATLIRIFRRLTTGLFNAIKESGEFVENLNLFAVTFGENYQETLDWALEFADNLGVASNEIVRFTGLFKQLADSIGITQETATEMSQVLTQLGYDLASFYNITTESAFEKLQAGIFSGQTKPLRSLGLDVTQQTLDNLLKTDEAFKDLGVTSSKALLQSDKAMLRLIVVLQNAQNSFGDINRTINTLSNQLRVFESSLSNLKLAIGDLFAEPFRNALIYINAFLIAITKIIRAFKPVATESETAGAGMQQFADDVEEATDASTGGGNLDFDEFRVLSSGENEQVSITEAITAELQKQIDAYNEQIQAMNEVSNKAVEIAEKIRDWFIVTDKKGNFVAWTDNAKKLAVVIAALTSIKIASWISSTRAEIIKLIAECKELSLVQKLLSNLFTKQGLIIASVVAVLGYAYATNEEFRESINNLVKVLLQVIGSVLQPIIDILNVFVPLLQKLVDVIIPIITLIVNLVSGFISLLDNLGLLEGAVYAIIIAFTAWKGLQLLSFIAGLSGNVGILAASLLKNIQKIAAQFALSFDLMSTKAKLLSVSIGLVGAALAYAGLTAWFNQMDEGARVVAGAITILVAALAAGAAAWMAFHGAMSLGIAVPVILTAVGAGVAGIQAIFSGIQGFAEGGITDANLIMTHENGVREWVGRQGNSTAVVNDTQMSDVMGRAVRNGVLEALSYNTGNGETFNITVQANLDGQKVYESTKRIARRNGEKFARV